MSQAASNQSMSSAQRVRRSVLFVAIVGGVLATFFILGSQAKPPPMGQGPQHKLRLNLKGELVGVESDPPVDPATATAAQGFVTHKKTVEGRVNTGCQACHGLAGQDLSQHACAQPGGRCLGEHHPPKTECIKCHR